MTIPPIGSILSTSGLTPTQSITPADTTASASGVNGNAFTQALDNLQNVSDNADSLAQAAATGNLVDIHNYTIAATDEQLTADLTVAVRDRAVEAFNQIMGMQV
jgi:flagellar hook-basal body complex protein FliE